MLDVFSCHGVGHGPVAMFPLSLMNLKDLTVCCVGYCLIMSRFPSSSSSFFSSMNLKI